MKRFPRLVWVAALCTVAVLAYVTGARPSNSCATLPIAELSATPLAVGRAIELPRLSGCFAQSVPIEHVRSGFVAPSLQADAALAKMEQKAVTGTAEALTNLGAALFVVGRIPESVRALEQSVAAANGANAFADLSAAYYVRGSDMSGTYDVVRALDAAVHATMLDAANPAAVFNRSLVLEGLHLHDAAERSWRAYLALDRSSPWRERATRGAADLSTLTYRDWPRLTLALEAQNDDGEHMSVEEIAAAFPQATREWLETRLLPSWAQRVAAGDCAAAAATLARARRLAKAISRAEADPLSDDIVTDLSLRSPCTTNSAQVVARGLIEYAQGFDRLGRNEDAVTPLLVAEGRLRDVGSPLARWAAVNRIYAGFNRYTPEQFEAALGELSAIGADASARGYLAVAGLAALLKGTILANRADFLPALDAFGEASTLLASSHEREYEAQSEIFRANALHRLGDYAACWDAAGRALDGLAHSIKPSRRYNGLLHVVVWAVEQHLDYAGLALLDALIGMPDEGAPPAKAVDPYIHRSRLFARLGFEREAIKDLAIARASLTKIPDAPLRGADEIELLSAEAEVAAHSDPNNAIERLGQTLNFFDGKSYVARSTRVRLLRAQAELAVGDLESAEDDLTQAVARYEQYRRALPIAQMRVASLEPVWSAFESLVALNLDSRRTGAAALRWAERSRARGLLDAMSSTGDANPVDPEELRADLPPDVLLVYYAVLPHRVATWILGRDVSTLRILTTDPASLEALCERFRSLLESHAPRDEVVRTSAELYDRILAPISDLLPRKSSLVFIPDGALHRVPFAALRDRHTGRFVIEDYEVTVAPSASVYGAAVRVAHILEQKPPSSALLIADPASGSRQLALPGARREAMGIHGLYPKADLVSGEEATAQVFVTRAPQFEVVHFAGHATVNPDLPLTARLEFASADGHTSDGLYADAITRMTFNKTRLVVLAACRTAYGTLRHGEGVSSLARPFLAAGVPAVIATLWDIDDRAASILFFRLHDALRHGLAPAAALRSAQLELLSNSDSTLTEPAAWAAALAIGGANDSKR